MRYNYVCLTMTTEINRNEERSDEYVRPKREQQAGVSTYRSQEKILINIIG